MTKKSISPIILKEWLDEGEAVLVDVREPTEHQSGSIPGSVLLPLGQISVQLLPHTHQKKLVIYCRIGVRSLRACELLLAQDPSIEVYNLEGGILSWVEEGNFIQ